MKKAAPLIIATMTVVIEPFSYAQAPQQYVVSAYVVDPRLGSCRNNEIVMPIGDPGIKSQVYCLRLAGIQSDPVFQSSVRNIQGLQTAIEIVRQDVIKKLDDIANDTSSDKAVLDKFNDLDRRVRDLEKTVAILQTHQ